MLRVPTTSRLAASAHLSLLSLQHATFPATASATFIRQATYSARKHATDSVKNNAKNSNSSDNNSPTRTGTRASHRMSSKQHGRSEPSAQNRRARYSLAKPKHVDTTKDTRIPLTRALPPKDCSQEKLVADQLINEPLPASQIQRTNQEPSRPIPAAPPPRVHRAWDHATREQLYKSGYKNAEKFADRNLRADVMKVSTSQQTATRSNGMAPRNNANPSGKNKPERSNSASPVVENVYVTNFWTVPDTERVSRPMLLSCNQHYTAMYDGYPQNALCDVHLYTSWHYLIDRIARQGGRTAIVFQAEWSADCAYRCFQSQVGADDFF